MTLLPHVMPVIRAIRGAASVLSLGFFGGWALGFLFLFFGFAIGRSGNTGVEEKFTVLEIGSIFGLAGLYGGLFGIFLFPIGYYAFLRKLPFRPALQYTAILTAIGGVAGAIYSPALSALLGSFAFFIGCAFATDHFQKS